MSKRSRGASRALASLLGASIGLVEVAAARDSVPRDKPMPDVVVTGSRIVRAGFDTPEPATVITSDDIESRGLTNIADALNESPGFGTATTPEGGQATFGPGLNFVNRFGLGSNRTLTLVNGRRVVSSNAPALFGAAPGSQVDLNFIPTALLDSIENLAGGWNFADGRGNVTASFENERAGATPALSCHLLAIYGSLTTSPTNAVPPVTLPAPHSYSVSLENSTFL